MADYVPLNGTGGGVGNEEIKIEERKSSRLVSLDVFRGLSIALMIFVDYAGSIFPSIAHSPWNGIQLADLVTPFFLFIVGVSLSLTYKKTSNKNKHTQKAILKAMKLFFLGVLLQGGYLHGLNSLTFGIDVEKLRWLGILQRIAIGYIIAALCEIWCSSALSDDLRSGFLKNYYLQWIVICALSTIYLGLLYGLYVPDWQFKVQQTTSSNSSLHDTYTVTCNVRGDLGPACNSAAMMDRHVLGINHLYKKPAYRNLKDCQISKDGQVSYNSPSWCHAPFDPEGILGSLMAAVTCIIGLQYGHVLVYLEDHRDRMMYWLLFSVSLLSIGLLFYFIGMPVNKQLYTLSYMLLTTGTAGFTFCLLYLLVDVYEYGAMTYVLELTGRHSLSIFILVASNVAIIFLQGFYWKNPRNNILALELSLLVIPSLEIRCMYRCIGLYRFSYRNSKTCRLNIYPVS